MLLPRSANRLLKCGGGRSLTYLSLSIKPLRQPTWCGVSTKIHCDINCLQRVVQMESDVCINSMRMLAFKFIFHQGKIHKNYFIHSNDDGFWKDDKFHNPGMDGAAVALSTLFRCGIFHPLFLSSEWNKKGKKKAFIFRRLYCDSFERVFMCSTWARLEWYDGGVGCELRWLFMQFSPPPSPTVDN